MVLSNFAKKRGGKAQLALPVPTPMTCALKLSTFKRDDIVNGRLEQNQVLEHKSNEYIKETTVCIKCSVAQFSVWTVFS